MGTRTLRMISSKTSEAKLILVLVLWPSLVKTLTMVKLLVMGPLACISRYITLALFLPLTVLYDSQSHIVVFSYAEYH